MCTVTIIPAENNDFVFTSNRDEAPDRETLAPDFYSIHGAKALFPKDKTAGGTWIGLSEKNRLVCVLNGAFVFHERQANYRMSRGIVAKDFMVADNIITSVETYKLEGIEPFTMVIVDWNTTLKLYELVWDGTERHVSQLPLATKIWSSSTLYSKTMKAARLHWFEDFKRQNTLDKKAMLKFHKTAGAGNRDYGVIMDRGFVKTTSITQIEKHGDMLEMYFENLQTGAVTTKTFHIPQIVNEQ